MKKQSPTGLKKASLVFFLLYLCLGIAFANPTPPPSYEYKVLKKSYQEELQSMYIQIKKDFKISDPYVADAFKKGFEGESEVGWALRLEKQSFQQYMSLPRPSVRVWDGARYATEISSRFDSFEIRDPRNAGTIERIEANLRDWELRYQSPNIPAVVRENAEKVIFSMRKALASETGGEILHVTAVTNPATRGFKIVAIGVSDSNRQLVRNAPFSYQHSSSGNSAYLADNLAHPDSQLPRELRTSGDTYGAAGGVNRDGMIRYHINRNVDQIDSYAISNKEAAGLEKANFELIACD